MAQARTSRKIQLRSTLDVSQSCGDVVFDESDGPLVLVSAGIGITPIAAVVEDLSRRQPDRQVRRIRSRGIWFVLRFAWH